jgi:hypothetical protein
MKFDTIEKLSATIYLICHRFISFLCRIAYLYVLNAGRTRLRILVPLSRMFQPREF